MAIGTNSSELQPLQRVRILYGLLLCVVVLFGLRLFYVQIIRHEHYRAAALSDQLKQYEVPASRGVIRAHEGDVTMPLVLNQTLYTVYADPSFIKKPEKAADDLARILGGNSSDYISKLTKAKSRYVIIDKKVSKDKKNQLLALKNPGIGAQQQEYRTYPQGSMAAQVLGFVNSEGKGTYGLEQALNADLAGTPGELKAITDINGVPLAANTDNISKAAVPGKDVTLTLDVALQKQVEDIVKEAKDKTQAQAVSAVVMDPNTGAVKSMANYPSYDPANYGDVTDASLFTNPAVSHPIEVGSTMKGLTTAAALDQGAISPTQTYYDPASFLVNGYRITNIEEDGGAGTRSIADILNLSLNTGVTWELMQMGGGQINAKARNAWHDYMTAHYLFGQKTGIEQGYEASGYVPSPKENGAGINLTYANTAFGQAMTATTLQMAGALSSAVNGGTYYQPHLVESTTDADGKAIKKKVPVLKDHVVSAKTSSELIPLMENVVQKHTFAPKFDQVKYSVGGKTGTAQIAKPTGGYEPNDYNGTYVGFVGGNEPQYVIAVFVIRPKVSAGAYAGTAAAQPVFGKIAHVLIDNSYVTPRN
jgi:stage V sporulation protein D (sporulation-specific penicillin-binding protein)